MRNSIWHSVSRALQYVPLAPLATKLRSNNMTTNNSNEVRYTAGPWEVREYSRCTVMTKEGTIIANCCTVIQGLSKEECEANARLIAAAPELLEALKSVLNMPEMANGTNQTLYRKIEQAISKAQGGV